MRMIVFVAGAATLAALGATPAEAQSRQGFGTGNTRAMACSSAKSRAEHKVIMAGYDVSSFSSCECSEAGQYANAPWECTADALYSTYSRSRERSYTPSRPAPRNYVPSRPLPPLPPMPDYVSRGQN